MSLFAAVEMAPRDPILGLNEQFAADPRPNKVNLGVGVYTDANGKLPLLRCVAAAEKQLMEAPKPRGYLPIDGIAAYDKAVQGLVFGVDSEAVTSGRVATVQALGGTGALKVGADFLKRVDPAAKVLISDPSWENHRALFTNAGFTVETYPYYDPATRGVDFPSMLAALNAAPAGTIVVLHACCHNPTGADITPAQWGRVVEAIRARGLVAFLDMAYQGFGDGIAEDGAAVRQFLAAGIDFFVATSFSKSFSLYGEREDRDPHELQQPADARRAGGGHGADDAGAAGDVGRGTRRHAPAHQGDARGARGEARGGRRAGGPGLHHAPEGHVQLLGHECGADAAAAQRVRHLRRGLGPHLRRRAQRAQPRRGRRGDRPGDARMSPCTADGAAALSRR